MAWPHYERIREMILPKWSGCFGKEFFVSPKFLIMYIPKIFTNAIKYMKQELMLTRFGELITKVSLNTNILLNKNVLKLTQN